MIDLAIDIMDKAHKDQKDKLGGEQILHPMAVGLMGKTKNEKIVGFLHDVIEDSEYTISDLKELGFDNEVIDALTILTRPRDMKYFDYIQSIIDSENKLAITVKKNDLLNNLERSQGIKELLSLRKRHIHALNMMIDYEAKRLIDYEGI